MGSSARSSGFSSSSEQVLLMLLLAFLCGFLAYSIYDAVMAAAANLMQRFLIISPMLVLIAVHSLYMSSSSLTPHPRGGGALVGGGGGGIISILLLVLVSIMILSYAPAFSFWSCILFQVFIGLALTV